MLVVQSDSSIQDLDTSSKVPRPLAKHTVILENNHLAAVFEREVISKKIARKLRELRDIFPKNTAPIANTFPVTRLGHGLRIQPRLPRDKEVIAIQGKGFWMFVDEAYKDAVFKTLKACKLIVTSTFSLERKRDVRYAVPNADLSSKCHLTFKDRKSLSDKEFAEVGKDLISTIPTNELLVIIISPYGQKMARDLAEVKEVKCLDVSEAIKQDKFTIPKAYQNPGLKIAVIDYGVDTKQNFKKIGEILKRDCPGQDIYFAAATLSPRCIENEIKYHKDGRLTPAEKVGRDLGAKEFRILSNIKIED